MLITQLKLPSCAQLPTDSLPPSRGQWRWQRVGQAHTIEGMSFAQPQMKTRVDQSLFNTNNSPPIRIDTKFVFTCWVLIPSAMVSKNCGGFSQLKFQVYQLRPFQWLVVLGGWADWYQLRPPCTTAVLLLLVWLIPTATAVALTDLDTNLMTRKK